MNQPESQKDHQTCPILVTGTTDAAAEYADVLATIGWPHRLWAEGDDLSALEPRPGAAIVGQMPSDRASVLRALLRARIAFFVCGTPGPDLGDVERLWGAVRKRRLMTGVLGTHRFIPAVARTRELADGGTLGALQSVSIAGTIPQGPHPDSGHPIGSFADLDLVYAIARDMNGAPAASLRINGNRWTLHLAVSDAEPVLVEAPSPTGRSLLVVGAAGQIASRFDPIRKSHASPLVLPDRAELTVAGRTRPLTLPEAQPRVLEMAAVLQGLRSGERPLAIPPLDDAVQALKWAADQPPIGERSGSFLQPIQSV